MICVLNGRMDKKGVIERYIKQGNRNKIVICHESIEGLSFFNVGYAFAKALKGASRSVNGYNMLCSIIEKSYCFDNQLGKYLALDNINILFEPDLRLDFHSFLDSCSRNQCLIVKTEMQVIDGNLCYDGNLDGLSVSLKGLSYLTL